MDSYEVCSYQIFEMSNERSISGRRKIKLVLHEIHPSHDIWQANGISWDEAYSLQNIESVANMSICAEFIGDERRLPYGHGLTDIHDNIPYMEDATVVGHCDKAYVDEVDVDGEMKKALVAEGYIDEMRYPKFVAWMSERIANGGVRGSVEIVGRPENDNRIIYDGGWKEKGRVPQIYDYSGYAILGISPADDTAIVIELNSKLHENKEDMFMDEKALSQFITDIKTSVTQTITEINSNNEDYENKIADLSSLLDSKDAEIAKLNEAITKIKDEIKEKERLDEEHWEELRTLREVKVELEKEKKLAELTTALSEFSAEEQALAQAEINAFKEDPASIEINSITSKICVEMVRLNKEAQNSEHNSAPDIFGGVNEIKEKDDVSIF